MQFSDGVRPTKNRNIFPFIRTNNYPFKDTFITSWEGLRKCQIIMFDKEYFSVDSKTFLTRNFKKDLQ